jgi:hypothetical protein
MDLRDGQETVMGRSDANLSLEAFIRNWLSFPDIKRTHFFS